MAEDRSTPTQKANDSNAPIYKPLHHRQWFWPAIVVIAIILILGFFASLWAWRFGGPERGLARGGFYANEPIVTRRLGRFGGLAHNTQNRLVGVVTAINGASFTVAGDGSTTNVQTTSSTQYQDGSQVKVNDSVVVRGSTSNGSFNASRVVINP